MTLLNDAIGGHQGQVPVDRRARRLEGDRDRLGRTLSLPGGQLLVQVLQDACTEVAAGSGHLLTAFS
jgi:hypothetical protein